jgi:cation diffusion facilitator family transporter
MTTTARVHLTRYAWISIFAAIFTITFKLIAYLLSNSVGLLSDALESVVNLVTAIVALIALRIAERPADEEFAFGYSKVEFFSSGFEGGMILVAACSIAFAAIHRLLHPQPLERVGLGLVVSGIATLVNFGVSRLLMQAGKRYESITLQADAHHLMADVITTVGVVIGVGVVTVTRLAVLDPVIALLVAVNILFTGARLLRVSYHGLMDVALPEPEMRKIQEIFKPYEAQGLKFHAVRSRSAGARKFISMHILVPGAWSVQQAHEVAEEIENKIRAGLSQVAIFTHIEPVEDPASMEDIRLEEE